MPTTGAAKAKQVFPQTVTVTVADKKCSPWTPLQVTANGKVQFENKDGRDYRIRVSKTKAAAKTGGVDILLPASGSVTLIMKKNEDAYYTMAEVGNGDVEIGGGPIRGGPH